MKRLVVALLLLALPRVAAAEGLTAREIVDRALARNAFGFENALARLTLRLLSKRGVERVREIEIRSREGKNESGKTLVRFHSPPDVAGTGFLVLEKKDADDDQYLYLPALGKVKRITGSQRNQRFMSTDLTYADLESRELREAKLTKLPDAAVGGAPVYVVEALPEDPDESQYSKTISWIHKDAFVALKVEFYDKKGRLLKTLAVHRLEKKEGRWVVMDSTIKNLQAGTQTRMQVGSIDFGVELSDSEFTQRALAGG